MNGRILVAVCGIGDPNFDDKISACLCNIDVIKGTAPTEYNNKIDFLFFAYDDRLGGQLDDYSCCKIVREPGFVGGFIYKHLQQQMVQDYDKIIIMLDDIKLQPDFNLSKVMVLQDTYNFDIISPSLTTDSKINHNFMKTRELISEDCVLHVGYIEFFMYVMNPADDSYARWLSCFTEHTKTMWGIDIILSTELGLKLGLINSMTMTHMFKGGSKLGGMSEMKRLFKRINKKHEDNGTESPVSTGDLRAITLVEKVSCLYKY
jgi:hypothetical protein